MIAALAPIASAFLATTVPNTRARPADQLADEIRSLVAGIPVEADEIESLMQAKVEATNGHNGHDGHDGHQSRPQKRTRLAPVKG